MLERIEIRCGHDGMTSTITIDGIDPGDELRSEAVNANVSTIAAIPEVRDNSSTCSAAISTTPAWSWKAATSARWSFPDTPYKIYVDAAEHVRAARRGDDGEVDSIAKRDAADSKRNTAPLIVADGAAILDNSHHLASSPPSPPPSPSSAGRDSRSHSHNPPH